MKKTILFGIFVLLSLSFSLFAETPTGNEKVKVSIVGEQSFPFPPLLFGTQAEVWVMPYLSNGQLQYYKDLGITLLRYPAGTTADWFLWDDMDHGYWPGGTEKRHRMSPDSFIDTCRSLGVEGIFEVNTSFHDVFDDAHRINPTKSEDIRKGAEYAANWVKDVNIRKKQGMKYWEIGNEVWIWMQAKENARHVVAYSTAMQAVDPTIKIIACGLAGDTGPFKPDWLNSAFKNDPTWKPRLANVNTAEAWTKALLYNAQGKFDYLALHLYLGSSSSDPVENGRETFEQIANDKALDRQIAWIKEARSPVRLAVTEWMTNFYHCTIIKKEKNYYLTSPAYSFVNVLLAADFFGKMMSTGYVDIAVAHDMTDMLSDAYCDPTGKVLNPPLELPAGAALRFWKTFSGDRVLKVNLIDCPSYEYKGAKVPLLSAYATSKGQNSEKVFLTLINRSPTEKINISINGLLKNHCPPSAVTEHTLSAPSWSTTVWAGMENPKLFPFKNADRAIEITDLNNYTVAPSRLTCLEIEYNLKTTAPGKVFKKVLIIGNSITQHGPQADLGWKNSCGMAATREDKDYAHLLYQNVCRTQPNLKPELQLAYLGSERTMSGYEHLIPCQADLIIVELGDNYAGKANAQELLLPYEKMLAGLKKGHTSRVYCLSTWGKPQLNTWIKKAAENQGAGYVDISHLFANPANRAVSEGHFKHDGVNWHPGDRGMQAIADILWKAIKSQYKPVLIKYSVNMQN
jgi:alpha-L-arabinofuranosidase